MKFTVETKQLIKNLKTINLVKTKVNKKGDNIQFSNILFLAKDGVLTLKKISAENTIEIKMYVDVEENGSIELNESIADIISNITDNEITITDKKIIKSNGEINIFAKEEFVTLHIDKIEYSENQITVTEVDFIKMVNTEYALAKDEVRPILTGLCIKGNETCSLDGYRIALRKTSNMSNDFYRDIILNKTCVGILNKSLDKKSKGNVTIAVNNMEDYVKITYGKITLTSRLLEGEYINYKNILPQEYRIKFDIETDIFASAVKSLLGYKKEDQPLIKLNIDTMENILTLTRNTIENTFTEKLNIKAESNKENLLIAFNAKYLYDMLNNYKKTEDVITMEFQSAVSPCLIKNNDETMTDLLLPVRLMNK